MRGRRSAGLVGDAHDERRPAAVDHRIGELRRDDIAPQPVLLERVGKALDHRAAGNSGRARGQDRDRPEPWTQADRLERELGIGQQHRQLRPRQRLRAAATLVELLVVGQELDRRSSGRAPPATASAAAGSRDNRRRAARRARSTAAADNCCAGQARRRRRSSPRAARCAPSPKAGHRAPAGRARS